MNNTQVVALRSLWAAVNTPKIEMTATEMALTSHSLNRSGTKATTMDGQVWYWVMSTERWAR